MARARNSSSPLFTLAALVVAVAALHLAKEILLPLALAILISFLLTPLANRLEQWRLGRVFSVISVVGVAFVVLGLLGWVVTSQVVDLGVQLPTYRDNLVAKIRQIKPESKTFQGISDTLTDLGAAITETQPENRDRLEDAESDAAAAEDPADAAKRRRADSARVSPESGEGSALEAESFWDWAARGLRKSDEASEQARSSAAKMKPPVAVRVVDDTASPLNRVLAWLGPVLAPIGTAAIAVVLVIFLLLKREDQRNRLLQLFGSTHLHATTEALTDVTERVSRYLRMQFLINAGYGVSVCVGLWFIGVPNAIMWGVLSFSLRFLPYIGPWMSAVMPLFVSIATSQGWTQPFMVVGWFVVLELIVNNVAEPLLYGRSTGVSGVGVIIAAVFWTWVWGPVGLVLAMPLTVCAVVMAKYIPGLRFLTVLLGDAPAMSDRERIYQRLLAGDVLESRKLLLERLNESSLAEVYDHVLIPALTLAERDRHAGLLHEEQEGAVEETARDLVEDLGEATAELRREAAVAAAAGGVETPKVRVLCIPLRDEADEISTIMLKQLLEAEGFIVEMPASEALTGEVVDWVESLKIDIAVISILPPLPPRSSRLLCRRLRDRYPSLPILVGYWSEDVEEDVGRRLCADDGEVVNTLAAAVERIRVVASHPSVTDKVG